MPSPNLRLRGGSYYWRRKITVGGHLVPLSFPLRTGNYKRATAIAVRLGAELEILRVAYGVNGTALAPAQLKKVFSDAMRWQLNRILEDQVGSAIPSGEHARMNSIHAEAWEFLAQQGQSARWTPDDHMRLSKNGWAPADAKAVAEALSAYWSGDAVSGQQLQAYADAFGIARTPSNLNRMERVVCAARAAACREATARLPVDVGDLRSWVDDALSDDGPLAFELLQRGGRGFEAGVLDKREGASVGGEIENKLESVATTDSATQSELPAPLCSSSDSKKLLTDAAEECIAAFAADGGWGDTTISQVRTAAMLFDNACGSQAYVEDVTQAHVLAFTNLCRALPSRWGRTRDEQERGLVGSRERAAKMPALDVGLSQATINKHITWIEQVLKFAGSDRGGGHKSAEAISFAEARRGLGKKARLQRKRNREKRANWTVQEIAKLLSAPVWSGSASLDDRLCPGAEVFHDAWYWLPLMLPLYGGRSSELVGLSLSDMHEHEPVPYFQIDFTDERALKNVQSIRKLPIHPELIRLGFIEYVTELRAAGHSFVFPEMYSPGSKSFASTFYKSIFGKLRTWAFPDGTSWRHRIGGAWRDKDVHSFRGAASSMLKGKVPDSVRCDILGHEGETETERSYDEEAELSDKLVAITFLSPLTAHIQTVAPIRLRPLERQKHGARRGRAAGARKVNQQYEST